MTVIELINNLARFAFGRKDPTPQDRALYADCLNFANAELFECVKNSRKLQQRIDIFFPDAIIDNIILPSNYINAIFADKRRLKLCDINNIFNIPSGEYSILNGRLYLNRSATTFPVKADIDGINKSYLTIICRPTLKRLVEVVHNPDIEINEPIYPEVHQIALLFGAWYFLILSNNGYMEKVGLIKSDWNRIKADLTEYYKLEI